MWFHHKPNTVLYIFYLFGLYPYFSDSVQFKFKRFHLLAANLPSCLWILFSVVSFYELMNQHTLKTQKPSFSISSTYVSVAFMISLNFISRFESFRSQNMFREIPTAAVAMLEYIEQTFHFNVTRTDYYRLVYRKGLLIVTLMLIGLFMNLITLTGLWSQELNYIISIELVYKDISTLHLILLFDFNRYLLDSVVKNLDISVSDLSVYAITYDDRRTLKVLRYLKTIHFKVVESMARLNDCVGWAALSASLDGFWRTMSGIYWGLSLDRVSYFNLICKYPFVIYPIESSHSAR